MLIYKNSTMELIVQKILMQIKKSWLIFRNKGEKFLLIKEIIPLMHKNDLINYLYNILMYFNDISLI